MGACGTAGKDRAVFGFDGDHPEVRVALLQYFGAAGQRAAGPDARDHRVHRAAGVGPDLLGRRARMDFGIRRVVELLRHDRIRQVGDQ